MAYTERVVRVYAVLILVLYIDYRLWYVPTVIISFADELCFAMEVPLGFRANVRQLLELLGVVDVTVFDTLQEQ